MLRLLYEYSFLTWFFAHLDKEVTVFTSISVEFTLVYRLDRHTHDSVDSDS